MVLDTYMIKPTDKHNRPPPPTHIKLHGLDSFNPPIRIHNTMFFPPTVTPFSEVVDNLKSSLAEALELYSPITGTVMSAGNAELYIAMDPESILETPFLVEVKDIPYSSDAEDVTPRAFSMKPSSSIFAVKVIQFSCGTIAICASIDHQVVDLAGFVEFLNFWAKLSRGEDIDLDPIPTDWTRTPDRFFSGLLTEEELNSPPSLAPFQRLSEPEGPAPFLLVESIVTRWKFSEANIAKLKSNFSTDDSTPWISTGDALSSLLCGVITRSRENGNIPRLEKRSSLESNVESVALAGNVRVRLPEDTLTNDPYFGNFNTPWSIDLSRTDLLSLDNEAGSRLASNIRNNLNIHLSPKHIAHKIAFFDKARDENALQNITWYSDIIITNWCQFDLQGPALNFGWDKPFYSINGVGGGFPPGFCLVIQTKDTGDITVLMTIEKDAIDVLKNDPLLNEYAELTK